MLQFFRINSVKYTRIFHEYGQHVFQSGQLWNQLLDDFAEGLENRMIVDGGERKGEGDIGLVVLDQFVVRPVVNISLDLNFVVIVQTINLKHRALQLP